MAGSQVQLRFEWTACFAGNRGIATGAGLFSALTFIGAIVAGSQRYNDTAATLATVTLTSGTCGLCFLLADYLMERVGGPVEAWERIRRLRRRARRALVRPLGTRATTAAAATASRAAASPEPAEVDEEASSDASAPSEAVVADQYSL